MSKQLFFHRVLAYGFVLVTACGFIYTYGIGPLIFTFLPLMTSFYLLSSGLISPTAILFIFFGGYVLVGSYYYTLYRALRFIVNDQKLVKPSRSPVEEKHEITDYTPIDIPEINKVTSSDSIEYPR